MEKLKSINRIKELYAKGENLMNYLKSLDGSKSNSKEDILISYDIQAGTYTKRADVNRDIRDAYCKNLANALSELGEYDSLLEVGVGEASTLGNLLLNLKETPANVYGFDLSWSRIKYANSFIDSLNLEHRDRIKLSTGDLFNAPFPDNSIDIVYTSHSIEPNGGMEAQSLESIYRIAKKYIVLLEPAYELANDEAKARMKQNGFVTDLYNVASGLGYNVIKHELFTPTFNPLNPTGIMIIKKEESKESNSSEFACPITHALIENMKMAYFAKDSLLAYPILDGIPCLLPENAILASHFLE